MKRQLVVNNMLWLLGIVGIFVFYNIDSMWTASVDLSHHYALAFRISEQWMLSSLADPTLGEMNIYPRGSHIIAAIVGVFLNSTLLGIQLTTLVSFALVWLCIILMLNSLPRSRGIIALIIFTGFIAANALIFKVNLHGQEVIDNFFYSQLVGHAFLFVSVIIAIRLEKSRGALSASIALVPLMLITATIHLLPALEMLGLIVSLIFVYVITEHQKSQISFKNMVFATSVLIISISSLLLHPSFSAMRSISENNGSLTLHNISYPIGLVVLCIVVAITSSILFYEWIKSKEGNDVLVIKYLAIYGVVSVALCLLQYGLTFFGYGSDYAVKKYGFGLTSILIIQLSIILSGYLVSFTNVTYFGDKFGVNVLRTAILSLALIACLFLNTPHSKSLDVSDIVLIERKLIHLTDTILPLAEDGKANVIIGLNGLPNSINYLFSISIIKTPRNLAIPDVLLKNDLTDPLNYSYIVSSSTNNSFGAIGCESISKGAISIISSQCFRERMVAKSYCKKTFDFSTNGSIPNDLLKGFSLSEGHGRWTDSLNASFECLAGDTFFRTVKLEITPFIHGSLKSQRLEIMLNGKVVHQEEISSVRGAENPVIIDLSTKPTSKKYTLEFKFPDSTSPKSIGFNEDSRKLGFSFQRITFE